MSTTDGKGIPIEGTDQARALVEAAEAKVVLTDSEIALASERRVEMTVPINRLRRVEFGIEQGRPVTLILVPESSLQPPQILTIPADQYEAVSRLLIAIAEDIAKPADD